MATTRRTTRSSRARITARVDAGEELTQVQFRMPQSLLDSLQAYTDELNGNRTWPRLTRSDVVRGVLEWAARTRPNWEDARRGGKSA